MQKLNKKNLLSNFIHNTGERLFPCVHFYDLNGLNNFVHNANASICPFGRSQSIGCRTSSNPSCIADLQKHDGIKNLCCNFIAASMYVYLTLYGQKAHQKSNSGETIVTDFTVQKVSHEHQLHRPFPQIVHKPHCYVESGHIVRHQIYNLPVEPIHRSGLRQLECLSYSISKSSCIQKPKEWVG